MWRSVLLFFFWAIFSNYLFALEINDFDEASLSKVVAESKKNPTKVYAVKMSANWCHYCKVLRKNLEKYKPKNTPMARVVWNELNSSTVTKSKNDEDGQKIIKKFEKSANVPEISAFPRTIFFKAGVALGAIGNSPDTIEELQSDLEKLKKNNLSQKVNEQEKKKIQELINKLESTIKSMKADPRGMWMNWESAIEQFEKYDPIKYFTVEKVTSNDVHFFSPPWKQNIKQADPQLKKALNMLEECSKTLNATFSHPGGICVNPELKIEKKLLDCEWRKQYLEKIFSQKKTIEEIFKKKIDKSKKVIFLGEDHTNGAVNPMYPTLLTTLKKVDPNFDCLFLEVNTPQQHWIDDYMSGKKSYKNSIEHALAHDIDNGSFTIDFAYKHILDTAKTLGLRVIAVDGQSEGPYLRNKLMAQHINKAFSAETTKKACTRAVMPIGAYHLTHVSKNQQQGEHNVPLQLKERYSIDSSKFLVLPDIKADKKLVQHSLRWSQCKWNPPIPSTIGAYEVLIPAPALEEGPRNLDGSYHYETPRWDQFDGAIALP